MKFKGYIFDMDGTLIDNGRYHIHMRLPIGVAPKDCVVFEDVLRLQAQIVEGTQVELAEPLRADMAEFLAAYEKEPLDPKTIGVPGTFAEALSRIREVFGV